MDKQPDYTTSDLGEASYIGMKYPVLDIRLAPIFSGREDVLRQRLSIMTRVLDGQGLQTDTGAHGRRGLCCPPAGAWQSWQVRPL